MFGGRSSAIGVSRPNFNSSESIDSQLDQFKAFGSVSSDVSFKENYKIGSSMIKSETTAETTS